MKWTEVVCAFGISSLPFDNWFDIARYKWSASQELVCICEGRVDKGLSELLGVPLYTDAKVQLLFDYAE